MKGLIVTFPAVGPKLAILPFPTPQESALVGSLLQPAAEAGSFPALIAFQTIPSLPAVHANRSRSVWYALPICADSSG